MSNEKQKSIEKLKELMEGIDICMLTTIDSGQMRSRPMSAQQAEFDGDLWFFTSDQTHKIDEVEKDNRVCVALSKPSDSTYVSLSGRASVVRDPAKLEELWNPILKGWFPEGLDDPHLCLLKISAEQAEYWESPPSKVLELLGFAKALATGESAEWGENKKLDLEGKGVAAQESSTLA